MCFAKQSQKPLIICDSAASIFTVGSFSGSFQALFQVFLEIFAVFLYDKKKRQFDQQDDDV